eukprot:TRINITY_DN6032_c0_g1_i4.p1 TRINITY_DN6032_c0_g1~~TRINITY_DN6032_c0_g1_i4.p1  ORF type:complete len:440 (-),score=50.60 TRINITY_DN6032_c0_g1_i4:365-1684(-)
MDSPEVGTDGASNTSDTDPDTAIYFAVVGDVHGQFLLAHEMLESYEKDLGISFDFVLQVGDIECYFIGGNHECYGWLDKKATGNGQDAGSTSQPAAQLRQVAHNCFYLGRAGYLPLRVSRTGEHAATVHIAFISGIHCHDRHYKRRPAINDANLAGCSNKSWIGFNCYDVNVLEADEEDDGVEKERDDWGCDDSQLTSETTFSQTLEKRFRYMLGLPDGGAWERPLSKADVLFLLRFVIPSTPGQVDSEAKLESAYRKLADLASSRNERDVAEDIRESICIPLSTVVSYFADKVAGKHEKRFLELLQRKQHVDILITHDWPSGLVPSGVMIRGSRPMGNEVCRHLLESLRPKLHCCGHMHRQFRATVNHTPGCNGNHVVGQPRTQVACVAKVSFPGAIAVYRYDVNTGAISEINPPAEGDCLSALLQTQEDAEDPSDSD